MRGGGTKRERERDRETERQRERKPIRLHTVNAELDTGYSA